MKDMKTFQDISIHAPREGGDVTDFGGIRESTAISIHAPREGGDHFTDDKHGPPVIFQSTPPARGATLVRLSPEDVLPISIHAPREGGDVSASFVLVPTIDFNPRPPRGGRHLPPIKVDW